MRAPGAARGAVSDDDRTPPTQSVTQAGDIKGLGTILRARRRSVRARSSLSSRRVKFTSAFVKRRQVLSSFVKAFLDKASGNFKDLRPPQVDKRASAKMSCRVTAVASSGGRLGDLKFMIGRFGNSGRIVVLAMTGHDEDMMRLPGCRSEALREPQYSAWGRQP